MSKLHSIVILLQVKNYCFNIIYLSVTNYHQDFALITNYP